MRFFNSPQGSGRSKLPAILMTSINIQIVSTDIQVLPLLVVSFSVMILVLSAVSLPCPHGSRSTELLELAQRPQIIQMPTELQPQPPLLSSQFSQPVPFSEPFLLTPSGISLAESKSVLRIGLTSDWGWSYHVWYFQLVLHSKLQRPRYLSLSSVVLSLASVSVSYHAWSPCINPNVVQSGFVVQSSVVINGLLPLVSYSLHAQTKVKRISQMHQVIDGSSPFNFSGPQFSQAACASSPNHLVSWSRRANSIRLNTISPEFFTLISIRLKLKPIMQKSKPI